MLGRCLALLWVAAALPLAEAAATLPQRSLPRARPLLELLRVRRAARARGESLVLEKGSAARRNPNDLGGKSTFEPDSDKLLDYSPFWRHTMHFPFLDDLEPVAPMDRVGSRQVAGEERRLVEGQVRDALYVPPYLHADAFPTVAGPSCECELPREVPQTEGQKRWAEMVAKQLGIPVSELPRPMSPEGRILCSCRGPSGKQASYHWTKISPVPNSNNFTISPADITYNAGDYWTPRIAGGLVAPQDRMPLRDYPIQARGDRIRPLPSQAREDQIAFRFAKYIDQVDARNRECDNVSPACTVPCRPGDRVEARLGNTRFGARVVSAHLGNAVGIEFAPAAAKGVDGAVPCPMEAACTEFRVCRRPGSRCVEQRDKHFHDFAGNLQHESRCPAGTVVCGTVQQLFSATYLRKDGKACRSAPSRAAAR